ncbi:TRAP transporter permease DctQ [Parazoarcus communis]|uniref:TRAP transporter small permease protein n=1 Tax=Parazoarcus communis TaxID=41977 RepID=A0A2U8GV61_9RHOO|nr:TRAP transporter permease DctQ [Parazoarcus communis]TVT60300.1 MAG: TRAP transporter small permease subunit [Azoarcus sp. PHD]
MIVPKVIRLYVKAITGVNRLLFMGVALLAFVIVPVMLYEVVARYVFNAPTVWGMELATLIFGPYFLLGGPYLLHLGGHVSLDLVHRALSPAWKRRSDLFNHLVIICFCAILLYYSLPLAMQSWAFRETSFSAWNPQIWPVKFSIPLAVSLLAAQSLAEFLCLLYREPSSRPDEDEVQA